MYGLGKRIRALRTQRGISQAALAEGLQVCRSAIAMWESGRRKPPLDMLVRIAAQLDVMPSELLSDDPAAPALTPIQTRKIPLLTAAEPVPPLETLPHIETSEPDCDFALRIADDRMAPTLLPEDLVFLRRDARPADGAIVALLHESRLCLRRVYRSDGRWTLLCDNPHQPPLTLEAPEIIGVAVAYRRSLHP